MGCFNPLFWNLNYWDKANTIAGKVEDTGRNFPRVIFGVVALVVRSYLMSLLAGTEGMEVEKSKEWSDGYFADVEMTIGGSWLRWWVQTVATMSNMGLFEVEMSSDSFQLLGISIDKGSIWCRGARGGSCRCRGG